MKKEECGDKNCPTHGTLKIKGKVFLGTVISDKMQKTVTVQWDRRVALPKYERYLKAWSRVKAHNPPCVNAKVGDYIRLRECRPLSKTKSFVALEVIGKKEVIVPRYEQFEKEEKQEGTEQ